MTTFRSEEMLVGMITFAIVPWIGYTIRRGLRDLRLPIGRTYVRQDERPGAFRALLVFYALSAIFMLFISMDLMLGLNAKARL